MYTYIKILPIRMRQLLEKLGKKYRLKEIRLRIEQPVLILAGLKEIELVNEVGQTIICKAEDVKEVLMYISQSSLYAFEEEIKKGFITVEGGHRIGLTGKTILEGGKIKNIKHFTAFNIRICHAVKGCSKNILPYIYSNKQFLNTLIISPPKCGKTTLLREMVRHISNGYKGVKGLNIGLVDERSEVASCYLGKPQNNVGCRTDILDCCPKVEGMFMLIRSMAPDVIVLDEIGNVDEIAPIHYAINSGCKMLCTIHSKDILELQNKIQLQSLLKASLFKRYIVLSFSEQEGYLGEIYNQDFKLLKENILLRGDV